MKRFLGIVALVFAFASCESDVKFNTPGFQAQRLATLNDTVATPTYEYWKANDFTATVNKGAIIIKGTDEETTLELYVDSYEFGVKYDLGVLEGNKARMLFLDEDGNYLPGLLYETDGDSGTGYIHFSNVDQQVPGTISGSFNVTVVNPNNPLDKITYNKGVFYQIPLVDAE